MPLTDLTPDELIDFNPDISEPADLVPFWEHTLGTARAVATEPRLRPVSVPLATVEVFDLTFSGYDAAPIKGWVTKPAGANKALPAVVEYRGYGAGRGLAGDLIHWASAGYVHVLMDTRGQGGGWAYPGDTIDPVPTPPSTPGFLTKGISSPQDYYYRRVFTDAVRCLDTARSLPGVDASRIAVTGISQGGGLSLATASLDAMVPSGAPPLVGVMPELPFLCHIRRAIELTAEPPVTEFAQFLSINRHLAEAVYRTLGYFDAATLGTYSCTPALFAVALMDPLVLPSTVYAAYNRYGRRADTNPEKDIAVYPFNGHEGGQHHHWLRMAEWLGARI